MLVRRWLKTSAFRRRKRVRWRSRAMHTSVADSFDLIDIDFVALLRNLKRARRSISLPVAALASSPISFLFVCLPLPFRTNPRTCSRISDFTLFNQTTMAEENMGPTMNNYLIGKITRLRKPASAGRIWKARCNNVIFE
jgi:hypothetical protein